MQNEELFPHIITHRQFSTPQTIILEFASSTTFIPGQVVAISNTPNGLAPRLYSIASAPDERIIRIIFDIKPAGALTPELAKLKPGDTIYASKPFGDFICDNHPAYWIATGTGIAPFVSMTIAGLAINKTLLHGARLLDELHFSSLFEDVLGSHYHRFCTAQSHPFVNQGRLTHFLKQKTDLPKDIMYYLCGSPEMVIEVRNILVEEKGISYEKVAAEIYF